MPSIYGFFVIITQRLFQRNTNLRRGSLTIFPLPIFPVSCYSEKKHTGGILMRYAIRACILRNRSDEYLTQLIDSCLASHIDEIMMCEDNVYLAAISQPLWAHREHADLMKKAVVRCREAGLRCTFYLKSLIGHVSSRIYALPYTKFVGLNGQESLNECCMLDEGFAAYAAELFSYYAECGFEKIMLDDDVRSINHCNGQYGCFCDRHLEATREILGQDLTRERMIQAFQQSDPQSLAIRRAHRQANFAGQLRFLRGIEEAVHKVDPGIQLGQMASGVEADQFQGRDMELFLQTLAGPDHRPFLRPPGGAYSETLGANLLWGCASGLKYRQQLGDRVDYVSEVEVFSPRNVFTKSRTELDLQMQLHALTGFDYLSLNLLDHYGTPPTEFMEFLDLLRTRKDHYDYLNRLSRGKQNWGIGIPVPQNYVENLENSRFGMLGVCPYPDLLQQLGLPVCYADTQVNFLTGDLLRCLTDEDVQDLLRKGAILDPEAVEALLARGFGELIGVSGTGLITAPCLEQLTYDPFNGSYALDRFPAYTGGTERCLDLKCLPGARILTEFVSTTLEPLGVGCMHYVNQLGGRILCLGSAFQGGNWFHKGRRHQLHQVVADLWGSELPFDLPDALFVAPIWYRGETEDLLALFNFSADEQSITLTLRNGTKTITLPPMTLETMTI